jgi:hypothetical protein
LECAPLVADFDNDGSGTLLLLIVFPRDVTDHVFIAYRLNTIKLCTERHDTGTNTVLSVTYAF